MTPTKADAPSADQLHVCLGCGGTENHPKVHVLYGKNLSTGQPDWAHIHHDCLPDSDRPTIARWHDELTADPSGEGERLRAVIAKAASGVRGDALRGWIGEYLPIIGTGPRMATTGLDVGIGNALLDFLHPTSGTGTAPTVTGPINIRAMGTIGADDAHAGTEITTGSSYTSGGAGLGTPATWATAATASNIASKATSALITKTGMPARTIVALEEWSSDGTPKRVMWGAVTSLTTNIGDTVSIASGALTDTFA